MSGSPLTQARQAKRDAAAWFRDVGDVAGVGITRRDDGYAVKVNLRHALPESVRPPQSIDGVPIEVTVTGPIKRAAGG